MADGVAGLLRNPFERCPELDDACLPNSISSLLSELQSGLRSPRGLSILVGAAGCGKSMAAAAFARRIAATTRTALLPHPTSSVSAIARDALASLDASDFDFSLEEDWVRALHANVARRGLTGPPTAILIDDAHRLSPQTLEDLALLFGEDDEPLRLHVFLFGRPRLLERLQAGSDGVLDKHLLQICRLEPLGVRDSVRYLERRVAMSGAELATLFSDEAIDEIVQKSEGRLPALEDVATGALRRARRKGAARVVVEDVMAIAPRAVVEEDAVMAIHQQPLQFQLTDDESDDESETWETGEGGKESVEWGDEDEGDDEEWVADAAVDEADESSMQWDSPEDELERELDERAFEIPKERSTAGRNRMFGRAVLSLTACLGLVWAANHLPETRPEAHHGRDSMLVAEPLSSKPEQIMRLATTPEEADADAQVVAWRAQPRRAPVEAEPARPAARESEPVAVAKAPGSAAVTANAAKESGKESARASVGRPDEAIGNNDTMVGPLLPAATEGERAATGPARRDRPATGTTVASTSAKPAASAKTVPVKAVSAKAAPAVYTVQLGAFKTRSNAEQMVLRVRGKQARILREDGLYRVMSGSFSSKRDAVVHEASLKRAGFTTFVRTATF